MSARRNREKGVEKESWRNSKRPKTRDDSNPNDTISDEDMNVDVGVSPSASTSAALSSPARDNEIPDELPHGAQIFSMKSPPTPPEESLAAPPVRPFSPISDIELNTPPPPLAHCSNNNDGREVNSPDSNCPICLMKIDNIAHSDTCNHQFCFTCLVQWSKHKAECPLCKQTFKCVIHNVRSIDEFDRYLVPEIEARPLVMAFPRNIHNAEDLNRFRISRQLPPQVFDYIERGMASYPNHPFRPAVLHHGLNIPANPPYINPNQYVFTENMPVRGTYAFRTYIYRQRLWVDPNSVIGSVSGRPTIRSSAELYARNSGMLERRFRFWLQREIHSLCILNYDNEYILRIVMTALINHDINGHWFSRAISDVIPNSVRDHFVHELFAFARSPFDLHEYDRHVQYQQIIPSNRRLLRIDAGTSSNNNNPAAVTTALTSTTPSFSTSTAANDSDDDVVEIPVNNSNIFNRFNIRNFYNDFHPPRVNYYPPVPLGYNVANDLGRRILQNNAFPATGACSSYVLPPMPRPEPTEISTQARETDEEAIVTSPIDYRIISNSNRNQHDSINATAAAAADVDSDTSDIEVVCEVIPRNLREPEVIEISDDEESDNLYDCPSTSNDPRFLFTQDSIQEPSQPNVNQEPLTLRPSPSSQRYVPPSARSRDPFLFSNIDALATSDDTASTSSSTDNTSRI